MSPSGVPAYKPAVVGDRAFVDSESRTVTALDAATGAIRWQVWAPGIDEIVPSVVDDVLYTATDGGWLLALDPTTGKELWRLAIHGAPYGMAMVAGLVLIGANTGLLYAIGGS